MANKIWKSEFINRHSLMHIDRDVLDYIIYHPSSIADGEIKEAASAMIRKFQDEAFFYDDDDDDDASTHAVVGKRSSWRARILAAMHLADDDGDGSVNGETLLSAEDRQELEADIARAASDLLPLRNLFERAMATARPTIIQLPKPIDPRPADWSFWLAQLSWTAEEIAALLLDLEPRDMKPSGGRLPKRSSEVAKKLDEIMRHAGAGHITVPSTPDKVKIWIRKYGIGAPEALLADRKPSDRKIDPDPSSINHQTKSLYQKALLYLAVKHYGYDIDAPLKANNPKQDVNGGVGANSVAMRMEADLSQAGLGVTAKTLSAHLKRAAADLVGSGDKNVNPERLRSVRKSE